jgi:hypothetical protein
VTTADDNDLDVRRLTETLDRHGVDYLLVGGVGAGTYGALRPTFDFDCLAERSASNLDRLARAMKELGARLRVEGLSDDEAAALTVPVDGAWLGGMEISTWRTHAGDFDVLCDMPDRTGTRQRYEDLIDRAVRTDIYGSVVTVAALDDIIASKQWANRPKDIEALPELLAIATSLDLDDDGIDL